MVMNDRLERLLLALSEWGQRMSARHRGELDIGLAVGLMVVSFAGLWVQGRLHHPDVIVFCVLLPAPLVLHGRSPSLAFALIALISLVQWLISTPQLANASVLVALYWVALEEDLAHGVSAALVTELGAIIAAARWSPGDPLRAWVGLSGLMVAATLLGIMVRQRRVLVTSLHERAARLERERDREGELAAAAERARIAREMHDIVSHNLTVMISLADGARYAMTDSPETAREAIGRVSGPDARRCSRCVGCLACSRTSLTSTCSSRSRVSSVSTIWWRASTLRGSRCPWRSRGSRASSLPGCN